MEPNLDIRTALAIMGLEVRDLNGTSYSSLVFADASTSQGNLDPALLPLDFLVSWDLIVIKLIE